MNINLNGIEFVSVAPSRPVLGSTKGGWIYAGQRPAYEANLPAFFVMPHPLTTAEVAGAMGVESAEDNDDRTMEALTSVDVDELAKKIMAGNMFEQAIESLGGAWEVRSPTQAEWMAAVHQNLLNLESGLTERLADAPASNHRGAMMDGRPRPSEILGPAAAHMAAIAVHPKNTDITAMTSVPHDRPLPKVVARLVLTPVREGQPKRVPEQTDRWANLRSEVVWTTLLGIVPSFLIPIARGMGDYATEGWVNLLFGGLCAGFFTGALWRPRRPVLRYEDVS